jgi:cell division protein FtsL
MQWNRRSTDTFFYWMRGLGFVIVVLMFMVWQHVEAVHLDRQLKGLRKEEDELIFQNAKLQSQINQWLSPSNLEVVARKQLGMVPPDAKHRVGVELP